MPHRALIGLGGNLKGPLGEPSDYLLAAIERLSGVDGIGVLRISGFYSTAPWGKTDQSEFINAVAELACEKPAEELLDILLGTEDALGRVRSEKWGPRLIDLDLLVFGDAVINTRRLIVPHPYMHERAFVLVPLLELDPDFEIPGKGRADGFLAELDDSDTPKRVNFHKSNTGV